MISPLATSSPFPIDDRNFLHAVNRHDIMIPFPRRWFAGFPHLAEQAHSGTMLIIQRDPRRSDAGVSPLLKLHIEPKGDAQLRKVDVFGGIRGLLSVE